MKINANLDMEQNELQNPVIGNLSSAPSSPLPGQMYYDTDDHGLYFYNGTTWTAAAGGDGAVVSVNGQDGVVVLDHDDIGDGSTYKRYSATEKAKLAGVESAADVTDATNVAAAGAVMKTVLDAKGDLLIATAADTVARVPVGADGQMLVADSTETAGVKWSEVEDHAYTHAQVSASTTWSIEHNLDDATPVVAVVVGGEIVEPESIEIVDENEITITFGEAVSGTAKIVTSGGTPTSGGASAYAPKLYVYLPDYKPQSEINTMISTEIAINGKFWAVFWENFRFEADGDYIFVDTTVSGALNMGYSSDNKTRALNVAENVVVGIAGDLDSGVAAMMANGTKRAAAVSAIVSHVSSNGFKGVNVNFEPINSLTGTVLTNFRTFIGDLRTALDGAGDDLIITWAGQLAWDSDKPNKEYSAVNYTGESNMSGTNQFDFTLNDLNNIGFDIVEMQAYDQFYDFGVREFGVTSYDQVADAIDFMYRRIPAEKAAIIIGSYGVRMNDGDEVYGTGITLNNATRTQVTAADATFYSTATRQPGRGYLIKSVSGSKQMIAADQQTVDNYYQICKNKKLEYIGFWLAGDYYYPSER